MGGRRLLLFVVFMWSLSTALTPLVASSYALLLLARVMLGLGEGLGLPTVYHLFADCVPAQRRSTAFAYLSAAGGIGQALAAMVLSCIEIHAAFGVMCISLRRLRRICRGNWPFTRSVLWASCGVCYG